MGIVDEVKKITQGDPHEKVEVVVNEIGRVISLSWNKIDEERTGAGNIEQWGYKFLYQTEWDKVTVEMNYHHPHIEIIMKSPKKMVEHKIVLSDFVEKKLLRIKLKNQEELEELIKKLVSKIEES